MVEQVEDIMDEEYQSGVSQGKDKKMIEIIEFEASERTSFVQTQLYFFGGFSASLK